MQHRCAVSDSLPTAGSNHDLRVEQTAKDNVLCRTKQYKCLLWYASHDINPLRDVSVYDKRLLRTCMQKERKQKRDFEKTRIPLQY